MRTILAVLSIALAACASSNADADVPTIPEGMAPDHARLAMLTGRWEAHSVAEFEDGRAPQSIHVQVGADWELGGRYVVARSRYAFTDQETGAALPQTASVAWLTWDGELGRYRYWTFPASGPVVEGVMDFDPETNIWTMEEGTGGAVTGSGAMEYLSDTEKLIRWDGRPLEGSPFHIEGRSVRE